MVHLDLGTLDKLRNHYGDNEKRYWKEHPKEYVLLKLGDSTVIEFFSDKEPNQNELIGSTSFYRKIPPANTHRFNKRNKSLHVAEDYVEYCPNDEKTKLPNGQITGHSDNRYTEFIQCDDCECRVIRKPSDKRIKEFKENLEKIVFKGPVI